MTYTIVEGTTEPQDVQLQNDGAALSGTGLTVGLDWRETVLGTPAVAWLSQAAGTVRITGLDQMTVGTYHLRFTLTDASNKVGYCPNVAKPDVWNVVKA